jgi:hypothetical protein
MARSVDRGFLLDTGSALCYASSAAARSLCLGRRSAPQPCYLRIHGSLARKDAAPILASVDHFSVAGTASKGKARKQQVDLGSMLSVQSGSRSLENVLASFLLVT